jgi:chemotaxis protein histidine kinase CheA
MAKQAIERLKGAIWFETTEGKGTTFFIELPVNS